MKLDKSMLEVFSYTHVFSVCPEREGRDEIARKIRERERVSSRGTCER